MKSYEYSLGYAFVFGFSVVAGALVLLCRVDSLANFLVPRSISSHAQLVVVLKRYFCYASYLMVCDAFTGFELNWLCQCHLLLDCFFLGR